MSCHLSHAPLNTTSENFKVKLLNDADSQRFEVGVFEAIIFFDPITCTVLIFPKSDVVLARGNDFNQ